MSVKGFKFNNTVHKYEYGSLENIPENFAPEYMNNTAYAVGDYCTHDHILYRCTTQIAGEAWNASHWTSVDIAVELQNEVGDLKSAIEEIEPGLSDEAKEALLACFAHVAWIDDDGQDYYDALEDALYSGGGSSRESIFGKFTAGISVVKTNHAADAPHYNDYVCIRQSVAARACAIAPIPNLNYVFTVTDSSKYNIMAMPVTDLTQLHTSSTAYYDDYCYLSTNASVSWSASSSTTTQYVWITLKKLDGTEFTAEELANGAEAVFNYTSVSADDVEITSGMTLVNQEGYTYRMQNTTTAARACFAKPVFNDNYTFTVTDSEKYSLTARDISSLESRAITWSGNVDGTAYPTAGNNTSWVASDSASTPFVWLALKKNDGTEFTAEELANHGRAIFTYT